MIAARQFRLVVATAATGLLGVVSCDDTKENLARPAYVRFEPPDGSKISPEHVIEVYFRAGNRSMGPPTLKAIESVFALTTASDLWTIDVTTSSSSTPSSARIELVSPRPLAAGDYIVSVPDDLLRDTRFYESEPAQPLYVDSGRKLVGSRFSVSVE
jgi:hypothetical protein